MRVWVEIHCDVDGPECRSRDNRNPSEMGSSATLAYRWAREKALNHGWTRIKKGWACPQCRHA